MKQKPLKSKWYRANWFIPAHKKETASMRACFTEPLTLSRDGRTQYWRDGNGTWHVTKEPDNGTEQQPAHSPLQEAHEPGAL